MKQTIAIAAAGLLSFGIAGITPAAAYHFSPENSAFTGKGKTSATKTGLTLPCKASFTGNVDANGVGSITGGKFREDGSVGCVSVKLKNLPWAANATGRRTAVIKNVAFSSPIGDCGPGDITTTLRNGVVKFTAVPLPPDCTVSGRVVTTPTLSIVK